LCQTHRCPQVPKSKNNSGLPIVFGMLGVAFVLGVVFFFVLARSENVMTKSFAKMQEIGKTSTIEGCAQKNMEWYESCNALTQICEQSVSPMMRVCLVNGDKNSQCAQYGDTIYGYNFGATECKPYFSEKKLKKACADTYQTIADYCKAVRKIP
jgi:hypothetical protein